MSDEFLDKYDLHWKLRRAKSYILLLGIAGFVWTNWGYTFLTLKFVWACYFTRRHDLPNDLIYTHIDIAAFKAGHSFALLTIWMCSVWITCLVIDALWAPVDLTEAELDDRRSSAMRRYKLLIREARTFAPAEKVLKENTQLRSEMSNLHEDLVKLRLEMDKIESKKARKNLLVADPNSHDLFDKPPSKALAPLKRSLKRLTGPSRKPPPPKF